MKVAKAVVLILLFLTNERVAKKADYGLKDWELWAIPICGSFLYLFN